MQPNTPAEVGRGVTLLAEPADEPLAGQVEELFARVGTVVRVPEGIIDACAACSGVGPAYWALVAEAWVEAGDPARHPGADRAAARDRDDGRQRRAPARP